MASIKNFKIQSKGLLFLCVAAFILAGTIPLINFFIVFPRYDGAIIRDTEEHAVQLADHIARMITGGSNELAISDINQWTNREIPSTLNDFGLLKIKIFAPDGTILFSTSAADIGTKNSHDYFFEVVAQGSNFTKVVKKDQKSLEGEIVRRDVVETYVPIMRGSTFIGAFELYQDITTLRDELEENFFLSMLIPAPLMIFFLAVVLKTVLVLDRKKFKEEQTTRLLQEQKTALTEEKQRQEELFVFVENAKRQWETTMDCISELVFLTKPDFSIKRCNNAVAELTALSYRDIVGENFNKIIPDTKLDGGATTIGESLEYFHPSSRRWFFVSLFPVIETIDQEAGFVISMSDITSSKKLTETLAQTNEKIITDRNALQHALDNISVLIGEAIDGKSLKTGMSLDTDKQCWQTMECGKNECPCYGQKGVRCWQEEGTFCGGVVQGHFAKKFSSCTECIYFKEVTENPAAFISEQFNNLMFMLESKGKELEDAYLELKQTQGQLLQQEKMASVGQLAAGVAHEINNPVGFIASNIGSLGKYVERLDNFIVFMEDTLSSVDDDELKANVAAQKKKLKLSFILEDIKDLITESQDGCARVKKIVQDLKGFSRVDQAERQYADLNECLDTTLNMVTNELKYKTEIKKEYSTLSQIECHPQQLNQVFMNLLINAGHAITEKGVITIKTWQDDLFIYSSISDTGSGIKEENLKHIFEPFYTTKEVGKGTGLGLSIVYDIITKNHKGSIDVTSEEGRGTTFTIQLPKGEDQTS